MSRIGKKPIDIPKGVEVKIEGSKVKVKGPKGELGMTLPSGISVRADDGKLYLERASESKEVKSLHGLSRSLIGNMVTGVAQGFQKVLEISGTGYRAQVQGKKIMMTLGYSHPVEFPLPEGITASVDQKQTTLTLSGIDKQLLGQVTADIKALRPPDVYKGKGVKYAGERLKLKVGKAGKK